MTKHEAAWLALRIIGLVLALSAFQHVAAVVGFVWLFFSGRLRDITTDLSAQISFQTALPGFIYGIAALAAAYYLIFRGEALHRLIMKEGKK